MKPNFWHITWDPNSDLNEILWVAHPANVAALRNPIGRVHIDVQLHSSPLVREIFYNYHAIKRRY
jgi:hypothetical protein